MRRRSKCVAAKNPPSAPGYKDGHFEVCNGGSNGGIVSMFELLFMRLKKERDEGGEQEI